MTNAFPKKFENHCHALALNFYHYNLQRLHKTLRVIPAMAPGISKELLSWETIIQLIDQAEQKALAEKSWATAKFPQPKKPRGFRFPCFYISDILRQ